MGLTQRSTNESVITAVLQQILSVLSGSTSPNPLTPAAPATATIGTSSGMASAASANRTGVIVVNVSVNTVSIAIGSTAVLNSGITLYPGGSLVITDGRNVTGQINAIASAAGSVLSIQEFT